MSYQDSKRTRKIIIIALLVCQGIVLSFIEKMIPLNFTIPGAKLGLANIVTLTSLYLFGFKDSLAIILLRTIMASFIFGSLSSYLYSVSGALLSFLIMFVLININFKDISTVGISVMGAISHNIGQLLMAALIIQNMKIINYLPFLMVTGVVTGCLVGATVKYMLIYLNKNNLIKAYTN